MDNFFNEDIFNNGEYGGFNEGFVTIDMDDLKEEIKREIKEELVSEIKKSMENSIEEDMKEIYKKHQLMSIFKNL